MKPLHHGPYSYSQTQTTFEKPFYASEIKIKLELEIRGAVFGDALSACRLQRDTIYRGKLNHAEEYTLADEDASGRCAAEARA